MNWLDRLARRVRRIGGRPARMRFGVGAGLRFDAGPSNAEYETGRNELPVQDCLARILKTGDVFYDVGANVGFMSVIAARIVGPQGRVYAFEPVPANAALLRRNAEANGFTNIHVVEAAVAQRSGRADLALAAYSGGSVLASSGTPPDWAGVLNVKVVSIDDIVEGEGMAPPDVVKVDVEGAELGVLQGMERTAARLHPAVLYEIDAAEPEDVSAKHVACARWLQRLGYQVRELPEAYPGMRWHVKHFLAEPAPER